MRGSRFRKWRKHSDKKNKVRMPELSPGLKAVLYISALLSATLSTVSVVYGGVFPPAAEYVIYAVAAASLCISCIYITESLNRLRKRMTDLLRSNIWTARLTDDKEYRSVLLAFAGVFINIIFAFFNGIAGWMSRSAWFGTLCAYYMILGIMRAYWISRNAEKVRTSKGRRNRIISERKLQMYYGILFVFLAVVLCGAVILLVSLEGGKSYPGWTIYAAAMYSFTKVILAVCNVVKARRKREQEWIIIRDIGLVDAAMSILTLQTAMFASFSVDEKELTIMMNGITGTVVSLLILGIGITYLVGAWIRRRV